MRKTVLVIVLSFVIIRSHTEIIDDDYTFSDELGETLLEENRALLERDSSELQSNDYLTDPLKADDYGDLDLYDIIILSQVDIETDTDLLDEEQKLQIVEVHNIYRRNFTEPIVSASDMRMMEYNNTLAWSIREYLKLCGPQEHGRSPIDNMTKSETGQMLYYGASKDLTRAAYLWYMEWDYYNYSSETCKPTMPSHLMCTHFVQLMAGRSQHVGCARNTKCNPLSWVKSMGCSYHPKDNRYGHAIPLIYRFGDPCTRNEIGDGNLCHKNLCVDKRMCNAYNLDCTCESNCQNCAVHNVKECKCECKDGWDYEDCSAPCEDLFVPFSKWHKPSCYDTYYNTTCTTRWAHQLWCRKSCGLCYALDPEKIRSKEHLCCDGKTCPHHHVLNKYTCKCELQCPSIYCMYNKTTITNPQTTTTPRQTTTTPRQTTTTPRQTTTTPRQTTKKSVQTTPGLTVISITESTVTKITPTKPYPSSAKNTCYLEPILHISMSLFVSKIFIVILLQL